MLKGLSGGLTALLLVSAAALPVCVPAVCCSTADAPTMHMAMPCCEGEAGMERDDPARVQTEKPILPGPEQASAHLSAPRMSTGIHVRTMPEDTSLFEPSPPLFLRNEQFLI